MGDADGKYLFKHVANYESSIVYNNAILGQKKAVDYHAIPHAVFSFPEIASVGLKEEAAIRKHGANNIVIGAHRYQETPKGKAMDARDYFAKVIVERRTMKILGAHTIGPSASILIQEIVNLMYTPERNALPIIEGMHIHPALTEVVDRALNSLMTPEQYQHITEHLWGLPAM